MHILTSKLSSRNLFFILFILNPLHLPVRNPFCRRTAFYPPSSAILHCYCIKHSYEYLRSHFMHPNIPKHTTDACRFCYSLVSELPYLWHVSNLLLFQPALWQFQAWNSWYYFVVCPFDILSSAVWKTFLNTSHYYYYYNYYHHHHYHHYNHDLYYY